MKKPVWSGDWPIPKYVNLPGVRVKVVVKPLNQTDGCFVYSADPQSATIYIHSALPLEVQRYTLVHELDHVTNDLVDQMLERFPTYVKTKHMAGIPPWEAQDDGDDTAEGADGVPGGAGGEAASGGSRCDREGEGALGAPDAPADGAGSPRDRG